ncbi:hypothetical protein TD95_001815 [Thielaviopsis punctulata]|uniref:RNA polymerase II holoenzyme cyclin-like subunit n=1 Tax=Thielaviopsis punctulata TaxID=72032 RepID=A0A0F4ZBI3_9PEZI|nr:hypothetical protein TD95_001815 [Thielaviopsis punctulata]
MASVEPYRPPHEEYRAPTESKPESDSAASVLPAAPSPPASSRKSPPSVDESTKPAASNGPKTQPGRAAQPTAQAEGHRSGPPPDATIPQRPPKTMVSQGPPTVRVSQSHELQPVTIDMNLVSSPQWYFTEAETLSTPSVLDGISPAEERLRRAKGINFIYQAGALLELPQMTLWVAGVFFHRFYMRYSLVENKMGVHHYNIAATALFLANKTEEICRKTKEIIIAVAKVGHKNPNLIIDEQSKEYWRWRDSILTYEELMLELLTFDLQVDNPYDSIRKLMTRLNIFHNRSMRQAAWAFCNDTGMTCLPLILPARDIAVAAIFFASVHTQQQIDDVNGKAWWDFLYGDEARCALAIRTLVRFYEENPLRRQTPALSSPQFDLANTRRRAHTASLSPGPPVSPRSASASVSASASASMSMSMSASVNTPLASTSNGNGAGSVSGKEAVSPAPLSLKRQGSMSEDGDGGVAKRPRTTTTAAEAAAEREQGELSE